jgi:hypothetical protein
MNFSTKEDGTAQAKVSSDVPQKTITESKIAIIEDYFTHVERVLENAITEEDERDVTALSPLVLLFGPPGVGKTASIKQVSEDLKEVYKDFKEEGSINKDVTFEVKTFSLASASSSDVLGVPYLKREKDENGKETDTVDIAINKEFTEAIDRIDKALKEGKEHFVIFFFDEITNVTYPEVLNFLMKFVDEGILVNKRLPDDVRQHILLAAAGNTMENSELAQFNKLPDPIMRRASAIIKVVFSSEEFLQWAKSKLHPYVWGFLDQFPQYSYITLQNEQSDNKTQITPSKWFDVSKFLFETQNESANKKWTTIERALKRIDPNMRAKVLKQEDFTKITLETKLGNTIGNLFNNYLQYAIHIPSISKLVKEGIAAVPPFAKMDAKGKEQGKEVQLNFGIFAAFIASLQGNIEKSIDTLRKKPDDDQSIKKINALYDILAKMIIADFKQTKQNKGQDPEKEKQDINNNLTYFVNVESAAGFISPLFELLFQNESNSFVKGKLDPKVLSSLYESMRVLVEFDEDMFIKVSNLLGARESASAEMERG